MFFFFLKLDYSTRESGPSETLQKPTLNKIDVKIDPELENKQIRDILGDDDDDDDMEDEKSSENSDKVMPISLDSCMSLLPSFCLIFHIFSFLLKIKLNKKTSKASKQSPKNLSTTSSNKKINPRAKISSYSSCQTHYQ